MLKRKFFFIFTLIYIIASSNIAGIDQGQVFRTALNEDGLGIVKHLAPFEFHRGEINNIPVYQPGKRGPIQVDLRSYDLRGLKLSSRTSDLLMSSFDDRTKWPDKNLLGFDQKQIMENGKNSGLNIRKLHKLGISGKHIGVAIIDQGLLFEHVEYKERLRLYEEIHCADSCAQMHGPAVASIAVGKTVGVAPDADLYYIAETHVSYQAGEFKMDFSSLAQSIDRIIKVNRRLPKKAKIRVISISVGWDPQQKGYAEVMAAVERAKKESIFVISSSLSETYEGKFNFQGLGREPMSDPDTLESYHPGISWENQFFFSSVSTRETRSILLVPMDSRSTASPTGPDDYVFYREGGWSWCIPYIAGLYALACQIKPNITPEIFWAKAIETGDCITIRARKQIPTEAEIEKRVQRILDERLTLLKEQAEGKDLEKVMAEIVSQMTSQKFATINEKDFRSWATRSIRKEILADTEPQTLKTIVNPIRLISALEKAI